MGSKNQKLNLDRELLYRFYVEDLLTTKQISIKFKDLGIDVSPSSIRNYLTLYNIPKRTRSEVTTIQINQAKENDLESYIDSRKRAGESVSKTMELKGFDELSRLSKLGRKTYYENRTEEQRERDRQIQIKRGENGRQSMRESGYYGLGSSKSEDDYYNYLISIFGELDVVRHYRDFRYARESDGYKYNCDFYIPSKDLFIEYNGFYTHGKEPFDKQNPEHIKLLEEFKAKGISMSPWYISDRAKVRIAKKNKLNLLSVYPNNKLFYTSNGKTITLTDITSL